mmetsp:Transcript_22983/g.58794  ORF Transcript_22983/g.58794 Transcript_22983/m.58794 type:complete len:229 (-) Transcript_22983:254-940(-)
MTTARCHQRTQHVRSCQPVAITTCRASCITLEDQQPSQHRIHPHACLSPSELGQHSQADTGSLPLHLDQLNVDEQRLVNHALVLKHKVERALAREGGGCRPLLPPVIIRVGQLHWHDDAPDAPRLHARHRLLHRGDHLPAAQLEAVKVLVLPGEAAALGLVARLKGSPVVADGVARPVDDHGVTLGGQLALAQPHVCVLEATWRGDIVRASLHAGLAIVLALQGIHRL